MTLLSRVGRAAARIGNGGGKRLECCRAEQEPRVEQRSDFILTKQERCHGETAVSCCTPYRKKSRYILRDECSHQEGRSNHERGGAGPRVTLVMPVFLNENRTQNAAFFVYFTSYFIIVA